jgi:hypothetical protein
LNFNCLYFFAQLNGRIFPSVHHGFRYVADL